MKLMIWPLVGFLEIISHGKKKFFCEDKVFLRKKKVYLINDLDQDCNTTNAAHILTISVGDVIVYGQDPI